MTLVAAYDIYMDVSNKAQDGKNFYEKLLQRVGKIGQAVEAIEAACKFNLITLFFFLFVIFCVLNTIPSRGNRQNKRTKGAHRYFPFCFSGIHGGNTMKLVRDPHLHENIAK